jgi:all-trans-retinol 13,14-reductase
LNRARHRRWDAIVVGSGLGGLTAAAYLSANGLRTLVLEQAEEAGGCGRTLPADGGFRFDLGLHYVGDCEPGGAIPTVLGGLGLEHAVEFLELDPNGFDTVGLPGLTFRVPRGWERYLGRLIEAFPDEERGLRRCAGVLERMGRELETTTAPTSLLSTLAYPLRAPAMVRWGLRPLKALYDACALSAEARAVISAQSGNYGTPSARAPAAIHAGLLHHFLKSGAFYPRGGGGVIALRLVEAIAAHGGEVRTGARVDEILVEARQVTGVRLRDGERLRARVVLSNADLKRTYLDLIGPEHLSRRTLARVERLRMALPLFCVHLGLDVDLRTRMPVTNYWQHPDSDEAAMYRAAYSDAAPAARLATPSVFVTSGSLKDPDGGHAPTGRSTLELMTMVPAAPRFWGVTGGPAEIESHAYAENGTYRATKDRITEALVDRAGGLIEGLRDHIVHRDAATPLTHDRLRLSTGGAAYGLEVATDQFGPRRPGAQTKIGGLYLVGAGTIWGPGVVGVMTGGVGSAGVVLGRDLHAEIRAGRIFA